MNHLTKRQRDKIVKLATGYLSIHEIISETKTEYSITRKFMVDRGLPFRRLRKPKVKRVIQQSYNFTWDWARSVEPNLLTAA